MFLRTSLALLLIVVATVSAAGSKKFQPVGCYMSSVDNHVLKHRALQNSAMTHEMCRDACYARTQAYFGLLGGDKCYCGEHMQDEVKVPDRKCSWRCGGNHKQMCGGDMGIHIFKLGDATPVDQQVTKASDAASPERTWSLVLDNLSDYELIRSYQAESDSQCVYQVSRETSAQVATFNANTGVCNTFRCRLGLSHCRKCRSRQQGNQLVWAYNVSCWTTLQHRVSGSVDFYRNWSDYKAGFGEGPNRNFWIGLDTIYNLTAGQRRQLRFLMKLWNGTESWAQYSSFSVAPETDRYRLSVSGFSGSPGIGDALNYSNGYQFSTRDRDSDYKCAATYPGAWWFSYCFSTHPNGVYQGYPAALNCQLGQGVIWNSPFGLHYSLMEIEILSM